MDLYIFRLEEGDQFRGVIVIFAADLPSVWHMLAIDRRAAPIPGMVARNEAVQLVEELNRLAPGAIVTAGASPLGQVFGDAALTQGYRISFVERDHVNVMGAGLSEASARGWVEHWYRQLADGDGNS